MKRLFVLLVSVLMLSACATVGNKGLGDPKVMDSLVVNQTTMAQVTALLGDANEETTDPDFKGDKVWIYRMGNAVAFVSNVVTRVTLRFHNGVLADKSVKKIQY